jgi:putative glutamine amidotransferase
MSAEPRPVIIGLTTYLEQAKTGVWDVPAAFLPKSYFQSIGDAGGVAVLLPPQPVTRAAAERVLDGLDALVLTGGKDVDPARYGEAPHPTTDAPRLDRDAWEAELAVAAIDRGMPILGICRGLQLLNVLRGGTLHQHLPEVVGSERYNAGGGVFTVNEAIVDAGTRTASLVGAGALPVKSYHHQGLAELGEGLVVTARSDDGTIQAAELAGDAFCVAVQWHPEEAQDAGLFAGLVEAARAYADERMKERTA